MAKKIEQEEFGPNIWLVDDMYRRYLENPRAVGESWREFFEDYTPGRGGPGRRPARDERPAGEGDGAAR
jgi:2-oxoglutarate decarboxylase